MRCGTAAGEAVGAAEGSVTTIVASGADAASGAAMSMRIAWMMKSAANTIADAWMKTEHTYATAKRRRSLA